MSRPVFRFILAAALPVAPPVSLTGRIDRIDGQDAAELNRQAGGRIC
jgi:hypothetical protein